MSRPNSQYDHRMEEDAGFVNPPISIDEALGLMRQSQPSDSRAHKLEPSYSGRETTRSGSPSSARYVLDSVRSQSPSSPVRVTRSIPVEHNLSILAPSEPVFTPSVEAPTSTLIQVSSLDPIPAAPETHVSLFRNLHQHQRKKTHALSNTSNESVTIADEDKDKLERRKHAMATLSAGIDLEKLAADTMQHNVQSTTPVSIPQPYYLALQPQTQMRFPGMLASHLKVPASVKSVTVHYQLSFFDLKEREFVGSTTSTSSSPLLQQRQQGVYFFLSSVSTDIVLVVEAVAGIQSNAQSRTYVSLGWTFVIPYAAAPNIQPVVPAHGRVTEISDYATERGELLTTPFFAGSPRALLCMPSTAESIYHTLAPAFGLRLQHTLYHCKNQLQLQHLLRSHKAYRADLTHAIPGLLPSRQLHSTMNVTMHQGCLPAPQFQPSIGLNLPPQYINLATPVVNIPAAYTAQLLASLQTHYTLYESPLFTRGTPSVSARKLLIGVHNGEKFVSNPVVLPLYASAGDQYSFNGNAEVQTENSAFYADKSVFLYVELLFEISWTYAQVLDRIDLSSHRENTFDQCISSLSLPQPSSSVIFRAKKVFKDTNNRVVDYNTGRVLIDEHGVSIKNGDISRDPTPSKFDYLTHDNLYQPNTKETVPLSAVMHRSIGVSLSGAKRYGFHSIYEALEEQSVIYLHTQVSSSMYSSTTPAPGVLGPAVAQVDNKLVVVDDNPEGSTIVMQKEKDVVKIQTKKSVIKIKATRKAPTATQDATPAPYIPSYTNPTTKSIVTSRPVEQRAFVLHRGEAHYFEIQLQNIISTDFVALITVYDPVYDMQKHIQSLRLGGNELLRAQPEVQVLSDLTNARVYRAKGDPANYVAAIGPWNDQILQGLPTLVTPTLLNGPDSQPNTYIPSIVAQADAHTRCYLVIIPQGSTVAVPFTAQAQTHDTFKYAQPRDVYITASTLNGQAIGQLKLSIIQP